VCATCGNHSATDAACLICADERQWVPRTGQRWTTLAELAGEGHGPDVRPLEPGLTGIGTTPAFAIGQRSVLVQTVSGNLLWDPSGYIDPAAVDAARSLGGVRYVTASHPHFYGSMGMWQREFDATVLVPEADASWLTALGVVTSFTPWSSRLEVLPGVTLVQCGGHFPGSAVVHCASAASGAGALLSGDTIMVTPGEDRATFSWSVPNLLPMSAAPVRGVWEAVRSLPFDRVYGGWWNRVLYSDAKGIVERSVERYLEHLRGEAAPPSALCQRFASLSHYCGHDSRNNNHRGPSLRTFFRKLLTVGGAAAAAGGLVLSTTAPALADTTDVYVQKAYLGKSGCNVYLTAVEGHNYASLMYNNVHAGVTCYAQLERSTNHGKTWSRVSGYDAIGSRAGTTTLAKTYSYYAGGGDEVRGCLTVKGGTSCTTAVALSGGSGVPAQEALSPSYLHEVAADGACQEAVVSTSATKSSTATGSAVFLNQSSGHTCVGWLERTKNNGKTWYVESGTHSAGSVSGATTYAITATYQDGSSYKVRACVRYSNTSAKHCTAGW